jgi:phenylacetate-CoA ligase
MKNIVNKFLLKKNVYESREFLDELRVSLLKKQLLYSYGNIPFYKKSFSEADIHPGELKTLNDLAAFPVINKNIVRLHHSDLINQKAFIKNKFRSHTSGSTGQPMWTYYNLAAWIRKKYLVKARARMECGAKFNEKIAIFEASYPAQTEQRNKKLASRMILNRIRVLPMFELPHKTVKNLESFLPDALYGSPSFFFQLAQYIKKNDLNIPSIKRIFTSSEYLQENARNYIEKIFNAGVFDIYGSTEFKEVAWECGMHEGYHINEDEVIVEILRNGRPAAPGEVGNVVITDLRNKVMPLIRFQMYDKGMLLESKCSCGRTFSLMKPYAGRSSECIILPNDEILSPYLFTTNIENINGLLQYQIVQTTKNKILVRVVTGGNNFDSIASSVQKILTDVTGRLMEIEIQKDTDIDVEENGKFKVVKNLILENRGTEI